MVDTSELHFVGVGGKQDMESIGSNFLLDGLLKAREKTWNAFHEIRGQIREGMTEPEARTLSLEILSDLGSKKHWHRPYVRFGPGTSLSFHDAIQTEYRLRMNDPVYIDLGPVWPDVDSGLEYEGDVGDTYVFGKNEEAELCAKTARQIFKEACQKWKTEKLSGVALYGFLKKCAEENGYRLIERVDGHRLSDYPHTKYSKERLAKVPFNPATCLWILEVQIVHPTKPFGAFFEDLLE